MSCTDHSVLMHQFVRLENRAHRGTLCNEILHFSVACMLRDWMVRATQVNLPLCKLYDRIAFILNACKTHDPEHDEDIRAAQTLLVQDMGVIVVD